MVIEELYYELEISKAACSVTIEALLCVYAVSVYISCGLQWALSM